MSEEWKVGGWNDLGGNQLCITVNSGDACVATVWSYPESPSVSQRQPSEESLDRAYLIAQAPEMLRLLKRLVGMWKGVGLDEFLPDCLNDELTWDEAAEVIKQAERVPNIFEDTHE